MLGRKERVGEGGNEGGERRRANGELTDRRKTYILI